jgi:putative transcriptional regulator
MRRITAGVVACAVLCGTVAVALASREAKLEAGLLLYAAPGLPDDNFTNAVILLVEHGSDGSLGVVINRPTERRLDEVFDLKAGTLKSEVPLYWGGPVQPKAVLALVRSSRPGPQARTIVTEVQITRDVDEVRVALGEPGAALKVRVFSGYAGWGAGQLAAEVRRGAWVLDRADAKRVFSSEPSRLWNGVYEILNRVKA